MPNVGYTSGEVRARNFFPELVCRLPYSPHSQLAPSLTRPFILSCLGTAIDGRHLF